MKYLYYDDIDYATKRLYNTVIKDVDGEPFFVSGVKEDALEGSYFGSPEPGRIVRLPLEKVSLEPVQLGYVNKSPNAYYCERMPMRNDWCQGLSNKSFRNKYGAVRNGFIDQSLYNTVKGIYPSFKEALQSILRGDSNSVAFSRKFAVDKSDSLLYRELVVGKIVDKKPVLYPEKFFLQEELDEVING